jgi:acyl transferase domain-containing protein/NAD(P)-dependent dehydrogenase (short-subunit alcohol dehydrogenase family)/aryl carrier-like protein
MTDLSPNKQALLKIRELKQQIAELQKQQPATFEPIAIVSMACRFPRSSSTPEAFWRSLIDQTDEVSEVPDDRWDMDAFYDEDPEVPGKMYARHGVFLDSIDLMDPEFFGISPREATWVDPQQRLLMEVGWEAIERAGWRPEQIGESTGVFVGWMHNDYQNEASDSFLNLNPYIATGAAGSFLCGRLAYYLGLQGPSVAVDTACSSSLVALHLACQSLQTHDCDYALVGGVNAICSPTTNILTCKLKALSPSGHSRAFDATADGYLRGEGCGVVTLRRLSDAERDGTPILGVISGSAIGHNGFSSGLTAPNPRAQEKVIRQALDRAHLSAHEIGYLEAHGTGTELGDPIEMRAAAAALATGRPADNPLLVGSVKTNIGHLEAAAGMAGLIKVLLSLQNNTIPGQLNFETPNPHIAWDSTSVKVLTESTPWPDANHRIAGVSAFGMSGTNAHVIVASVDGQRGNGWSIAPPSSVNDQPGGRSEHKLLEPDGSVHSELITISAKNEQALLALAARYEQSFSNEPSLNISDVAYTSNNHRSHFEHRAALVTENRDGAIEGFRSLVRSRQCDAVVHATSRRPAKVAWQFTGQGSQYVGMARELYDREPVFRQAIDHCDELLTILRGESLIDVLFHNEYRIDDTRWTQPAIFAVQMGLAKLLMHRGLHPDVVFGHSVGQYAAACVARIMSWDDGLKLISERGRLIGELPAEGRMLAVFASLNEVEKELTAEHDTDSVSVAAMNGTHIVLSGEATAVAAMEQRFTDRGIRCKVLVTSHAFHSSLMDSVLQPFREIADTVDFRAPQIPLICNVSSQVLEADRVLNGRYWADHIRAAVRYSDCVDTAQEVGCELLLELGPQGVLTRMAAANWKNGAERLVSCLHPDTNNVDSLLKAIGTLYVHGVTPDFAALYEGRNCRQVLLPTYPFQRRRFWGPDKPRAAHAEHHTAHPLVGTRLRVCDHRPVTRFESFVDRDSPSWLIDHQVMESVVMPGAAFLEMAVSAGNENAITNVSFEQPLQLTRRTSLQTVVNRENFSEARVEIHSHSADDDTWTRHFRGTLSNSGDRPQVVDLPTIEALCPDSIDPTQFYNAMQNLGLDYGPAFQVIRSIRTSDSSVLTKLAADGDLRGYRIPPPLLDGALHSLAVKLLNDSQGDLFLPVGVDSMVSFEAIPSEVWCHATWTRSDGPVRFADLTVFNDDGKVLLSLEGLKLQRIDRTALRRMSGSGAERLLYCTVHQPCVLPSDQETGTNWLVIADDQDAVADMVTSELVTRGNSASRFSLESDAAAMLSVFTDERPLHGIAWLLSDETQSNCTGLLTLVQTLQTSGVGELKCGLTLVTRLATHSSAGRMCNPHQAKYQGFGRVLGAELPVYRCRVIDLAMAEDEACQSLATDLLLSETRENEFAISGKSIVVPRLIRSSKRDHGHTTPAFSFDKWADESCLITGGLGSLGRLAASWLAQNGVKHLVLVSRRTPNEIVEQELQQIRDNGCEVLVHSADVTSHEDMSTLISRFGNDLPPLGGVIHAAGILDDGLIVDQSWNRFEKVLATKVHGAEILDELTAETSLHFFILYSSVASVLGSRGQCNYATANAFLDGLAWKRTLSGKTATSINWGPWTEGMADDDRIRKQLALHGITPLSTDEAHQCMEYMLANEIVQATVLDVDWRRLQSGLGPEVLPLLEGLVPARQRSQMGDSAFVGQLKRLRGKAQNDLLIKTLQEMLQSVLSTSDAPEIDRPLIEMGLDSLMAVEFSTQLQMMLGEQFVIGPTMLFDHPTIEAIADHVLEMLASEAEGTAPAAAVPIAKNDASELREREPVAIVGMSCRFPGARDLNEFWENLLNGVDSVAEIPDDRWDIDRFYSPDHEPGKMYTREGGFLDDIADFDAAFFNISDQEACWIDPQHRMLLENSYRALEHAGISPHPLADPNVGVFMGIMGQDYAFLPQLDDHDIIKAFEGAGLSHSAGVGRISYVFGFEGPSIAVDTASSSSLVALYQAVRSLQDGNCNMALAGGVNAILAPVNSLLMSKAGLLSPDGRCKSFSADADGFGRGEGCGVVVLKRLSDAKRDANTILAVVRGGAVVHNGFTGGITSPSGKAQARVISAALQDAKISPSQVQYLEAHGTGTEFGDPMELAAASSVYSKGRRRDEPLLVGSVKANISHLEAAGGISGLIKTVLSLHHGVIPPQVNFDSPSPHIPWKRMPVRIVTEATSWPDTAERIAGVTALGLVGTNAHIVLSSVPNVDADATVTSISPAEGTTESGGERAHKQQHELLMLSARTEQALLELLRGYEQLFQNQSGLKLADVCYTAATGRRHYEHRIAVKVSSLEDAHMKLKSFAETLPSMGVASHDYSIGTVSQSPQAAWIFSGGQRSDIPARDLFASEPAFQKLIVELDNHLSGRGVNHINLEQWLKHGPGVNGAPEPPAAVQAFVLHAGIAAVFKCWGVEPDVVAGFGVGQYSAACVAGCLCFKDALELLANREAALINPSDTTLNAFESFADQFNFYPPNMPLVCSLSGDIVPVHKSLGGSYWRRHVVEQPKVCKGLETLEAQDCDLAVEISPVIAEPLITPNGMKELVPALSVEGATNDSMKAVLGRLYTLGATLRYEAPYQGRSVQHTQLPFYPFQKRRYWITEVGEYIEAETDAEQLSPLT